MPLQRGEVLGYDFNRRVVDFTMFNQGKRLERASRKFFEGPVEAKGPVVLRSNDFFK